LSESARTTVASFQERIVIVKLQNLIWKWLNRPRAAVFAFAALAAYQGAHYATAAVVHEPAYCCGSCTHQLAGKRVPQWVDDDFFWLAYRIDELIAPRE
jgi:hypothetical protein